ncbi:hypothetical protein [Agromyces ramosus]|uniref:GH141-like insertion domain-containing protein n=1 Tax=Agromyces ramosus TaxID=33879 RepID=A0ABU0RCK1_9MICO|nr:hypothetical protein [Agromyces ramosus]MDQ0895799.1 hypothetical protein [Agromyces ramosus]
MTSSRTLTRIAAIGITGVVVATLMSANASPAVAAPNAVQATLHASPTGSGTACTSTSPCSLEGARDRVRLINAHMTGDIVVKLAGGDYAIGSTFRLTESSSIHDSGTNGFTIRYEAAAGATPVFSGGRSITGFSATSGSGSTSIYSAPLPSADFAVGFNSRELYVNGVRATRARSTTSPSGFVAGNDVNVPAYTVPTTGQFAGIASWTNQDDMEIVSQKSWKMRRWGIASVSGSTATMDAAGWTNAFTQPGYYPNTSGVSWLENAKALLDTPGEWFLDRTQRVLSYMPKAGEDLATASVVFGGTVKLLDAAGTSSTPLRNVTFDGVRFEYDSWLEPSDGSGYADFQSGAIYHAPGDWSQANYLTPAGVSFGYAKYITVKNCTFTHMANAALSFGAGVQNSVIDREHLQGHRRQRNQCRRHHHRRPQRDRSGSDHAQRHGVEQRHHDRRRTVLRQLRDQRGLHPSDRYRPQHAS